MTKPRARRRGRTWAIGAVLAAAGAIGLAVAAAQTSAGADQRPVLHERVEGLADFRWEPVDPETAVAEKTSRPVQPGMPDGEPDELPPAATELPEDIPIPPRPGGDVSDDLPAQFQPDLDTDQASLPSDPNPPGILWSPSPGPYLRQQVFDVVRADGTLDTPRTPTDELRPVEPPLGTGAAERFIGRARLRVAGGSPVQLPSPAPEFRAAIVAGAEPGDRLAADRAGNLYFVPGATRGARELVLSLEADTRAFGGALDVAAGLDAVPFTYRPSFPEVLRGPARRVADRLGLPRDLPVEELLRILSGYFRSFVAGPPPAGEPGTDYELLALGRVGLCRHRAYAFVLTAQALGLPARMPVSRLHAWVEVLAPVPDANGLRWLWRRVDLGGAYGEMDENLAQVPAHVPELPDPLPWPRGTRPTPAGLVPGASAPGAGAGAGAGTPSPPTAGGSPPATTRTGPGPTSAVVDPAGRLATPGTGPSPTPGPPPAPRELASTAAVLDRYPFDATRGEAVAIAGRIPDSSAAPRLVQVVLEQPDGQLRDLGSLAVGGSGTFAGTLTVPPDVVPGDYVLRAYVRAP